MDGKRRKNWMVRFETTQELPQTYSGHSYDTGGYCFKAQLMW